MLFYFEQIKRRFQSGPLASRAMTASVGELSRDFDFVLSQQMVGTLWCQYLV